MRSIASLAGLSVVLAGAVGGAGCNTYKYFDVHATFDATAQPPFTRASAFTVTSCKVTVSGADSAVFRLPTSVCPNMSQAGDALDAGSFEFSTFADSGTMNFKLEAFQMEGERPECMIGLGMLSLPVTGLMTTPGELKIKDTGMHCATTGGTPRDGSIVID